MRKKSLFAVVASAAAIVSVSANVAFAGEVNGSQTNPKSEFSQGKSICKFSGLNDSPSDPFPEGGKTQSFGQLVNQLGPLGGVPGTACNPTKSLGEP